MAAGVAVVSARLSRRGCGEERQGSEELDGGRFCLDHWDLIGG